MKAVGKRIKQLRVENRMTQEDFAETFSVSRGWITNIETGKREPTELLIRSISNHFAVREEWLRTGELPIRDYSADAVSSEIAKSYFELAAELAPSIDTPELLTNMLKNSSEYSEIFHYISFRFLNLSDKNEPKRLAALFSVAFPDYADVAEELIKKVGHKQKELIKNPPLTKKVPIHPAGKAVAGNTVYYNDFTEERMVEIPAKYLDYERYFSVEVKGDSMEPNLFEGDIVIVAKNVLPSPGQTALIHINDSSYNEGYLIKRYYPDKNGVKLVSNNKKYDPIYLKSSQVVDIQLIVFSVHNYA